MTHEQQQSVSSLVSDLVTMAEATRRLPEVERELVEARAARQIDGDHIARLEIKLQQRSQELDELKAKLRSVEAERDDAGFRQLEAEDRFASLQRAIESSMVALGETLGVTDGSGRIRLMRMTEQDRQFHVEKVRERTEAERFQAEAERKAQERPIEQSSSQLSVEAPSTGSESLSGESGERVADPTSVPIHDSQDTQTEHYNVSSVERLSTEGQSEPLPTAHLHSGNQLQSVPTGDAVNTSDASPSTAGKYHGKKYYDHPYYVSEDSWVANGGTLEDYHAMRPAH